jgi:hypothetical protein
MGCGWNERKGEIEEEKREMRQLSQASECTKEGDVKEVRLISKAEAEIWRERPGRFPPATGAWRCGGSADVSRSIVRGFQPYKMVPQDVAGAERYGSSLNQQASSQIVLQ